MLILAEDFQHCLSPLTRRHSILTGARDRAFVCGYDIHGAVGVCGDMGGMPRDL